VDGNFNQNSAQNILKIQLKNKCILGVEKSILVACSFCLFSMGISLKENVSFIHNKLICWGSHNPTVERKIYLPKLIN